MNIKIGFASYGQFTSFINQLRPNYPENIKFVIYDELLEDYEEKIRYIEKTRMVDIFVASGSNCNYLLRNLKEIPLVEVKVTGFDLLFAIQKAKKYGRKIGILTMKKRINYLAVIKNVVDAEIHEFVYTDRKEIDEILDTMYLQGIEDVIGSTYTLERAALKGMRGHFIWSIDGINYAIETAIQVVQNKIRESERTKKLNSILNFAHEGIIVTDRNGTITELNEWAEKILGFNNKYVIGSNIKDIIPNTRLDIVMNKKKPEYNKIQDIGNVKVITNRSPILNDDGEVIGSIATFQNTKTIHETESKIKRNLYKKGFLAKTKFHDLIGESEIFQTSKNMAKLYAKSESNILISGETGTGKELFAQSIHNASLRNKKPFVAVNCAAIPKNLLESELFGYEEGAFSGAKKGGKIGVFEIAHSGTIFLDEISEIPVDIQSKLLRILEERKIFRIGGEKYNYVDIRVIAASNKNLWEMVQEGKFREDLYYRLNVLEIILPPLRKRKSDIPLLMKHFLKKFQPGLSSQTIHKISNIDYFLNYNWPGNIRELRNVLERFSVLYRDEVNIYKLAKNILVVKDSFYIDNKEKQKILETLEECNGNKSIACQKLNIGRTTLWRKMKEYEL